MCVSFLQNISRFSSFLKHEILLSMVIENELTAVRLSRATNFSRFFIGKKEPPFFYVIVDDLYRLWLLTVVVDFCLMMSTCM